MKGLILWALAFFAAFSIAGTIGLLAFIFLHRMGRATSRFDRREKD